MFMAFSLLPSCLPIMPPDAIQVADNLGYYWSPNGGVFLMEIGLSIYAWAFRIPFRGVVL
jgi:hypothetical protein